MMVTVMGGFWFRALRLLVHQTVRRGYAAMRVRPIDAHVDRTEGRHTHLNGK